MICAAVLCELSLSTKLNVNFHSVVEHTFSSLHYSKAVCRGGIEAAVPHSCSKNSCTATNSHCLHPVKNIPYGVLLSLPRFVLASVKQALHLYVISPRFNYNTYSTYRIYSSSSIHSPPNISLFYFPALNPGWTICPHKSYWGRSPRPTSEGVIISGWTYNTAAGCQTNTKKTQNRLLTDFSVSHMPSGKPLQM